MLTSAPSPAAPFIALGSAPDDLSQVCAPRKKRPAGTAGSVATAGPASGKPGATPKGSSPTRTPKPKARRSATSPAGYALETARGSSATAKKGATAKKAGPLAFLDDTKLSVDEKLLRLLAYLNDKWNKDLDQKMKAFKQTSAAASSSGASTASGGLGGLLKKAVSYASMAVPALGIQLEALQDPTVRGALRSVAGPALAAVATGFGQPELAPVALKYGPDVVDALASATTSVTRSGGARSGASSSTTTKESADGIGGGKDDQLRLMEMERILSQQKEMFSLVSNMLRTTHETRMAVIQNIR